MEKYLGNKRWLLSAISDSIDEHCGPIRSLCDVFAGTTNVGRFFRRRGVTVISNDINRFSFVLAKAYLDATEYPRFRRLPQAVREGPLGAIAALRPSFDTAVRRDAGLLFPQENAEAIWRGLRPLASVLAYLNGSTISAPTQRHFHDHYTVFGRRSRFVSVRGSSGKRNYFSRENALRLDAILETIRRWWKEGLLEENEVHTLLTAVLEEVVITANVNGTFHDFNRDRLWPNALQEFSLKVPLICASDRAATISCDDAVRIGPHLPAHDVLYLDPPYNFRQYTAYYHLLNFVAAYPFLSSVDEYLASLEHVRGQNMSDDFSSDFCAKDRFLDALGAVVDRSRSRYVVMSYYGGRNHWNHWAEKENPTDEGYLLLEAMFSNQIRFEQCTVIPVLAVRKNYQSRIGEHKQDVREHLFIAKKRRRAITQLPQSPDGMTIVSSLNEQLKLDQFSYVRSNSSTTLRRKSGAGSRST